MTKPEIAGALALSVGEFDGLWDELTRRGFPAPIAGLGERWSIMDVMNWVNRAPNAMAELPVITGSTAPVTH